MNKLLLLFLIIFKLGFGQETKYFSEDYVFKNGEIAYMFGNDVKLREQPNTTSSVLSLLKIGEQIEIVEQSNLVMEFDGIKSPWYKVKAKNKVGFMLGSLISLDQMVNGNQTYLMALKKEGEKLFVKTRVLEKDLEFKENVSELLTSIFSVEVTGNKGLKNINNIVSIEYLAESCGANGGGIYLFYDGKTLIKAIEYTQVIDADLYWFNEAYVFPNENGGVKGKIVYKSEIGETKESETQWTESRVTRRLLEWNGEAVLPKIEYKEE